MNPKDVLRYHVTGAIERGEAEPVTEIRANELTRNATDGEQMIATKLIDAALAEGYAVDVNDGEETTVTGSRDRTEILDAMATTGTDWITLSKGEEADGAVMLVYGNAADGSELLADWHLGAVDAFLIRNGLSEDWS